MQFACTNNMAEYEACIFGLKMALEMEIKELITFSDSDLLIYQTLKQKDTAIPLQSAQLSQSIQKFGIQASPMSPKCIRRYFGHPIFHDTIVG